MSAVGTTRLNAVRAARFETKTLSVTVTTDTGRPASLSGAKLYFTARPHPQGDVVITKTIDDGIEVTDAAKGIALITLSTEDTDLPSGQYRYDVWVEMPGTPPKRYPVIRFAELLIEDSVHTFGG